MSKHVEDIQWSKGKTKIAKFKNGSMTFQKDKTYEVLKNGTLKIKHLERIHDGTYKVDAYDSDGKNVLEETFHLSLLGKSLFPKFLHLIMGAVQQVGK